MRLSANLSAISNNHKNNDIVICKKFKKVRLNEKTINKKLSKM